MGEEIKERAQPRPEIVAYLQACISDALDVMAGCIDPGTRYLYFEANQRARRE